MPDVQQVLPFTNLDDVPNCRSDVVARSDEGAWLVRPQGLHARHLKLDIMPYGNAFQICLSLHNDRYAIIFDSFGTIAQVHHLIPDSSDVPTAMATAKIERDN